MSGNIYKHGEIYEHDEEFDEDKHSHFNQPNSEEMETLRQFICDRVIPNFKDHRHEEYGGPQFAVLVLLNGPITDLTSGNWDFRPLTENGRPCVDSRYLTQPQQELYQNYVVARPQVHRIDPIWRRLTFFYVPERYYEHAEEMLVNEFDRLRASFACCEGRSDVMRCVIVFSWLFPCDECTSQMIRKWGPSFREENPTLQRVIIAFRVYWRRASPENCQRNRERLKENGFDILRVKC